MLTLSNFGQVYEQKSERLHQIQQHMQSAVSQQCSSTPFSRKDSRGQQAFQTFFPRTGREGKAAPLLPRAAPSQLGSECLPGMQSRVPTTSKLS